MEAKLFDGEVPHVSTFAFHEHRERAPHMEQWVHRPRLFLALEYVAKAVELSRRDDGATVSDLGCGDGGLLQRIQSHIPNVNAWGYDFQPSNSVGWAERGVTATAVDVFGGTDVISSEVKLGNVDVMTEVLEHLARPHAVLSHLYSNPVVGFIVVSSPWTEHEGSHDECHAWAWDMDGYSQMISNAGFHVLNHTAAGMFQILLASAAKH
jgi:2-polyprenyl-3-methyl-5-hydroxy-6-metoxy-1,4-benzoquinol methylase